jgi:hypothetical protein
MESLPRGLHFTPEKLTSLAPDASRATHRNHLGGWGRWAWLEMVDIKPDLNQDAEDFDAAAQVGVRESPEIEDGSGEIRN